MGAILSCNINGLQRQNLRTCNATQLETCKEYIATAGFHDVNVRAAFQCINGEIRESASSNIFVPDPICFDLKNDFNIVLCTPGRRKDLCFTSTTDLKTNAESGKCVVKEKEV